MAGPKIESETKQTKLKNAIDVSVVEDLNFSATKKKSREWEWELLPDFT